MKTRPAFDHYTCPRCAGSGEFKPRVKCFTCGGTGWKLSKRGKAAAAFLVQYRKENPGVTYSPAMRAALAYEKTLTVRGRVPVNQQANKGENP